MPNQPLRQTSSPVQPTNQALSPSDSLADLEILALSETGRPEHWLRIGQLREQQGDRTGGLQAFYKAVTGAQRQGFWHDANSTPKHLLEAVIYAIEKVRVGRKDLFLASFDSLRQEYGSAQLKRVDHALSVFLREICDAPPNPNQKPRLFYFPGLPEGPYHDPFLHPWTQTLCDSFEAIKSDALRVLGEDGHFEDFIKFRKEVPIEAYLKGNRGKPAWEAFFFYRHGIRFDENHSRCQATSSLLESIELCRIDGEAPEICFSVMTPGTEILPHYGVTNVRLVMHLPLVIPSDCALNVIGCGEHRWIVGKPMLFDDTFRHEAWNRSPETRVVLLMDCWNPHLEPVERQAMKLLLETVSGLGQAARGQRKSASGAAP